MFGFIFHFQTCLRHLLSKVPTYEGNEVGLLAKGIAQKCPNLYSGATNAERHFICTLFDQVSPAVVMQGS